MSRGGKTLAAALPKQPPAVKLDYRVVLGRRRLETPLNGGVPAVIDSRARSGRRPDPHILIMFLAMLLWPGGPGRPRLDGESAAAGDSDLRRSRSRGFVFGPLMQHYAFGAFWTGFPLGSDLTTRRPWSR
jgi:hypothetical protein